MKIGYVRVSTREQTEGDSLLQQTARVEKAGAVLIFSDVESGKSDKRSQFNKMLTFVKQGKATELIVTRIDRLARSVITIHKTIVLLEENKVKLTVLDSPVDPNSPFGWFSINQMAGLAEFESRLLSDRIKHGLNYFREQKKASPNPPFGFRRVNERYVVDTTLHECGTAKHAIAIEIVSHFVNEGGTLRSTCVWVLETFNIKWSAAGLRYWLINPVLRGHTAYGVHNNLSKPENWTIYYNTHEPLITSELSIKIDKKLKDNQTKYSYGNNKKKESLPLSGQIVCGDCGYVCYPLQGKTIRIRCKKQSTLGSTFCSNKVSTYLDKIITETDKALLLRAEQLAITGAMDESDCIFEPNEELTALKEQLKMLQQMPPGEVISTAINQTLIKIDAIQHNEKVETEQSDRAVKMLLESYSASAYWELLKYVDRRETYKGLVNKIVVLNGEILEIKLLV